MDVAALARALPSLCALALAGRTALALLPPGWPGSHSPRELPATWAASHLLGLALLGLELGVARALGWNPGALGLLAPFGLVAALRLALLPGEMVPRHEPPREAPGRAAIGLALAGGALLATRLAVRGACEPELAGLVAGALGEPSAGAVIASASAVATAVLCVAGLARARRAPLARASALFLLGLWSLARGNACLPVAPLLATGGVGVSIAWVRRADGRALALGALLFGAAALEGAAGRGWAVAGLAGLVLATAAASRGRVSRLALAALAAGTLGGLALRAGESAGFQGEHGPLAAGVAVAVLAVAELRRRTLGRRALAGADPLRPDPPRAELLACAVPLAVGGALELLRSADRVASAVLALGPLALLFVGLLAAPAEHPERRS